MIATCMKKTVLSKGILKQICRFIWDVVINLPVYLNIGKNDRPVFYNIETTCPELLILDRHINDITEELNTLLASNTPIPQYNELDPNVENIYKGTSTSTFWKVFLLTLGETCWISRWIPQHKQDIEENQRKCPKTTQLIKQIPGVFQVMFSILEGGQEVAPHHGPVLGSLRYHLCLKTPTENPPKLVISGTPNNTLGKGKSFRIEKTWKKGESFLWDDLWRHHVENNSKEKRIVLIVDIHHPCLTKLVHYWTLFTTHLIKISYTLHLARVSKQRKKHLTSQSLNQP